MSESWAASYAMVAEQRRLNAAREAGTPWKKWGPYLSERQWGTVREDYSDDGNAWAYFSHDQSRSRAYRWGEDGIAGVSVDKQILCFAVAWGQPNLSPYVRDAFHDYVIHGRTEAVNPAHVGTKAAAQYHLEVPANDAREVRLRLRPTGGADASTPTAYMAELTRQQVTGH